MALSLTAPSQLDERFDQYLSASLTPRIDLRASTFVTMGGLVAVACVVDLSHVDGARPVVLIPQDTGVANHLARMGLGDCLGGADVPVPLPSVRSSDRTDRLVELRRFSGVADVQALSDLLWHRFEHHVDGHVLDALDVSVGELADNVRYHSGLAYGYLAAHTYRRGASDEYVEVGIGDIGVGLATSLARYRPENDLAAIKLALRDLTSGLDEPGRGQGLTTVAELVSGLAGWVTIRSGRARRVVSRHGSRDDWSAVDFPGTQATIHIPTRPGA